MKNKTCCFTGHRKLTQNQVDLAKSQLFEVIGNLIEQGYTHFVSGFANGADLLCAEVVAKFKESNHDISLEAAIPNRDRLNCKSMLFKKLIADCNYISIMQDGYNIGCFEKRNRYMIDKSDVIIAIWGNNKSGSTYNAVTYARLKGKKMIVINV